MVWSERKRADQQNQEVSKKLTQCFWWQGIQVHNVILSTTKSTYIGPEYALAKSGPFVIYKIHKTKDNRADRRQKKISLTAIEVKISNSPARRGKGVDKTKILKLDKKITTFLLSLSDLKIWMKKIGKLFRFRRPDFYPASARPR